MIDFNTVDWNANDWYVDDKDGIEKTKIARRVLTCDKKGSIGPEDIKFIIIQLSLVHDRESFLNELNNQLTALHLPVKEIIALREYTDEGLRTHE